MPFTGEPRYNWVKEQYEAYRRRQNWGWVILVLALTFGLSATFLSSYLPSEVRAPGSQVTAVGSLGLFTLWAVYFNRDIEYYLPEIEDRLMCFLKPAVNNLRVYESKGKPGDKKKALEKLEQVAETLEEWTPGNLGFIKNSSVGQMLSDVQKSFRNGLLPAVKEASNANVQNILGVLDIMEKQVEQDSAISEERLTRWSGMFSRMLSRYPARQPNKLFWQRLPAKKAHLPMLLLVLLPPFGVGTIGVLLQVPIQTVYLGSIAVFGTMVGFSTYLLSRKKAG